MFALVCGFVVARSAGRRDAGDSITGEITKTARERNTECLNQAQAKPADAVTCYTGVLADSPNNVESLTYRGWIRFTSGDTQGLTDLRQAVMVDGTYPDVHAFLAVVLFRAGCVSDAANELTRLDALNPSPLILQLVADLRTQIKTRTGGAVDDRQRAAAQVTRSDLRIGGGQGFYGDGHEPLADLLADGVDYLVCEALAELTLAILQKDRQRDESLGYTAISPGT